MPLTTLLLLTRAEEYPYLRDWLTQYAKTTRIISTLTLAELQAVSAEVLGSARLIAFCTGVVVPPAVLKRLGYGAYNFHPGPPSYPGSAPAAFAIYDGAAMFGVTLHEMVERVDAGPIVAFDAFPMPPEIELNQLEQMTYTALITLFRKFCQPLATQAQPLACLDTAWGPTKSTRRGYARLCEIPVDISEAELTRRLKAVGPGNGEVGPAVTLHGRRFRLVPPHSG